jgi:two-component system OmpR family response regulator
VLVADADASIRDALTARLQRGGCRVLVAADGQQVVSLAAAEELDLIIVDAALPGREGRSVCLELAHQGPTRRR